MLKFLIFCSFFIGYSLSGSDKQKEGSMMNSFAPLLTGINHVNLAVGDMDVSFSFYKDVMGFTPLCRSEGSAYFLVGKPNTPGCLWFSLDLDREKKRQPSPCNSHMAFSISPENFETMKERLIKAGVRSFKDNTSPGESFYFLDPDGHKLEIHTGDWRSRLKFRKQDPGKWKNVVWYNTPEE